ncbi:MAG: phosphoribosylamine--glycine ligase [Candidatus Peribacteraceae bacterium]|nr:phosphoribosylamine--glycine ligase [Candidatus Peribacteraceae bacterium]
MKILLIANGAREHAVAAALKRSKHNPDIVSICTSNNPGVRSLSSQMYVHSIMDFDFVVETAKKEKPDFCFIGPDDPIGGGLADLLEAIGIPCVAPKKALAQVESSKGFTRNLMQKYKIDASPKFAIYSSADGISREELALEIDNYLRDDLSGNYVVKYDALKGGKGVKLSDEHLHSIQEGVDYALECIDECGKARPDGIGQVTIEEKLVGVEFSFLSFVSGDKVVDMPAVQDHKRAFEGDTGSNTGGMGTYTDANHSLPFLSSEDIEQARIINRRVAAALMKECGEPYKGILYGGYIAVKDGIRVIEFNARFGDPEVLNLLSLLTSDFVDICLSIIDGSLSEDLVTFEKKATVCKYIVPKSYPDAKNEKGELLTLPDAIPDDIKIYYGDVSQDDTGKLHLGGSRSIGVVGIGGTIEDSQLRCSNICAGVEGPIRYRRDIGTNKLLGERVDSLRRIRR